jgi:hypothetical protein
MDNKGEIPTWDDDKARHLVGKIVLVGITRLASDGETIINREQYFGTIAWADQKRGFQIDCMGSLAGTKKFLPPDLRSFRDASPGKYRLKLTGEIVINPEVLSTWYITKNEK